MTFKPGQSGNPGGRPSERPFRDALRMEIAAAGADLKALRVVARALLDKAAEKDVAAIREIADRLDGKPAQESHTTIMRKSAAEVRDDELAAIVTGGAVADKALN